MKGDVQCIHCASSRWRIKHNRMGTWGSFFPRRLVRHFWGLDIISLPYWAFLRRQLWRREWWFVWMLCVSFNAMNVTILSRSRPCSSTLKLCVKHVGWRINLSQARRVERKSCRWTAVMSPRGTANSPDVTVSCRENCRQTQEAVKLWKSLCCEYTRTDKTELCVEMRTSVSFQGSEHCTCLICGATHCSIDLHLSHWSKLLGFHLVLLSKASLSFLCVAAIIVPVLPKKVWMEHAFFATVSVNSSLRFAALSAKPEGKWNV